MVIQAVFAGQPGCGRHKQQIRYVEIVYLIDLNQCVQKLFYHNSKKMREESE